MIVVGIDPGLANTGWGVVEERGGVCRARAYGCVSTSASDPVNVRLGTIFRELSRVVERYGPDSMAVEEIFFGRNSRSAIWTAHARGAALVVINRGPTAVDEVADVRVQGGTSQALAPLARALGA